MRYRRNMHGRLGTQSGTGIHPYVREQELRKGDTLTDIYETLGCLILQAGQRRVCASHSCRKPEHELGRPLQLCSSCRTVR